MISKDARLDCQGDEGCLSPPRAAAFSSCKGAWPTPTLPHRMAHSPLASVMLQVGPHLCATLCLPGMGEELTEVWLSKLHYHHSYLPSVQVQLTAYVLRFLESECES